MADTPPPGSVKAKVYGGDGVTAVTTTGTALDVNVTNSGGTSTVNQGTAGLSPWLVHADNTAFGRSWALGSGGDSVSAVQSGAWTTGRNWNLNSGGDSVSIVGSVTATNSANGSTGSPVPAQATQVAGSDGTNLRALKVSSTGVVSVDGSSSTQPVSGSVSVANFPGVQAVSQSGTWTIGQGTPPWDFNLTQLAGASFSQTNYLPSRLTNGTAYVDPTQIRALTSSDVVTANQGGSWSVSVSNFPATQPVSGTVAVSNFPATQPISAVALPLPSGAATSANQTTANSSLSSIDSKLTAPLSVTGPLTDTQLRASAVPVSAASLPLPTGASTSALQTSGNASLTSIDSKTPALGQALAAASVPVVLTAAQLSTLTPLSTVAVTQSTSPWVVSGTVAATQSGTWNINNISGTVSLPTGAATDASLSTINANMTNGNLRGTVTANAGTNLNTSALALDATLAKLTITQGTALGSNTQVMAGGSVTTSVPSYTAGQISPLSLTTRGLLRAKIGGLDTTSIIRNDYSTTNVTTSAYVQLQASTSSDINRMMIFDSSGQDLVLAVGAAGSEVNQIQIPPGGWDIPIELFIPSGSRISVKASSATASSGILLITGLK